MAVSAFVFPNVDLAMATKTMNFTSGQDNLYVMLYATGTFTWTAGSNTPRNYTTVSQFTAGDGTNGVLAEVSTSGTATPGKRLPVSPSPTPRYRRLPRSPAPTRPGLVPPSQRNTRCSLTLVLAGPGPVLVTPAPTSFYATGILAGQTVAQVAQFHANRERVVGSSHGRLRESAKS